jgi:type I restriction enzyme M protein
LTESQDFVTDAEGEIKAKVGVFLYGKAINPETYAICKSDMMIKGTWGPIGARAGIWLNSTL